MTKIRIALQHRYITITAILFAVGLTIPCLWNGFCFDDDLHRLILLRDNPVSQTMQSKPWNLFCFHRGEDERTRSLIYQTILPWWMDGVKFQAYFFRPISSLSHWLDYLLWPDRPFLMHVHSLLWFGLIVGLTSFLYRDIMGATWVAGVAALFFAFDDAHGVAVGWLANRNTLLACVFALLCLLAHHRWRQKGWRKGSFIAPVCLVLSLLSAESGLGIVGYLLAYATFLEKGSLRMRTASLIPYGIVLFLWSIMYVALGCGIQGMAYYTDPLKEPLSYSLNLLERFPVFLLGQWALPPVFMYSFWPGFMHWSGIVFCILLVLILIPPLRQDHIARFWATGMIVALLPITAVWPHDRNLLFTGIGAMGLLACWFENNTRVTWSEKSCLWRITMRTLMALFFIIHGILAPLGLPSTSRGIAQFYKKVETAAASLPTGSENKNIKFISLTTPNYLFFVQNVYYLHALQGHYISLRALTAGINSLEVTRLNSDTIVLTATVGSLIDVDKGFCIFQHATSNPGHTVKQFDMDVKVLKMHQDKPSSAVFHFAAPLEDPRFAWFYWDDNGFVPFKIPPIGETVRIEGAKIEWM